MLVFHADGTSRLTAGDSQGSIDFSSQAPSHPIHRAYTQPDIEKELDTESRAAFGMGVTVDRYGGSVISLRLGEPPTFTHDNGRPDEEYLSALKSLPRLEDQGDGVRSYLGLLLHLAAGTQEILLIDEPEAFLHPPQARRLGSVLSQMARDHQVFIATHSSDILQGVLEGGAPVTIIRVTREGGVNHPAVLPDSSVKELWSDPLLRYSNVLDGLFHDAVILCESDADCRSYSAVLDLLKPPESESSSVRETQLLFTHCGGKARMASVVRALRAVSVPVVGVADFDIVRSAKDVPRVVSALGGRFANFSTDLSLVDHALASEIKPLRKVALRDEVIRRLDDLPDGALTRRAIDPIRALFKVETGWHNAKRAGIYAVPQGDCYEACERLLDGLLSTGLCVVPVGELEHFAPQVSGHGPAWASAMLGKKVHESPCQAATDFAISIRGAASKQSSR